MEVSRKVCDKPGSVSGGFATTQWTRVLAARGGSPEARAVLADLCAGYYAPVVTFLRCYGNEEDQARDLAHEFFARLLERGTFGEVERGRGRFRSYLLGAVKHFVADARKRERAAKRGGNHEHVSLEPGTEATPGVDPVDQRIRSPEREFDRQWAMTVLAGALGKLELECRDGGGIDQFDALKGWLTGEAESRSQAEVAARLGMNTGAVKVAIHRLRKRFRHLVRGEIAHTVSHPDEVREELRALIAAVG